MTDYLEIPTITFETALRAVQQGVAIGAGKGVTVCVTVVDPAARIVAYGRADGAPPHSEETSRRKAFTGASTRRPSGWMQGGFAVELPLGTGTMLTNIRGGFPIRFDGKVVGGLGIAGGTPDQDEEIGLALLTEIGSELPS